MFGLASPFKEKRSHKIAGPNSTSIVIPQSSSTPFNPRTFQTFFLIFVMHTLRGATVRSLSCDLRVTGHKVGSSCNEPPSLIMLTSKKSQNSLTTIQFSLSSTIILLYSNFLYPDSYFTQLKNISIP